MPPHDAAPAIVPIIEDVLTTRPPEQRRFETALRQREKEMAVLRRAIEPWSRLVAGEIIEATLFHCGLYYSACLPAAASRRSRANLNTEIVKSARLADQLLTGLRPIWNSRDPTVRHWLAPVIDRPSAAADDGLQTKWFDPPFVSDLDQLWRRLALLGRALPQDIGGPRPALAFGELVIWLAGIYRQITGAAQAPRSKSGHFFRYVAAVADLLRATAYRFPKATFDLPPNDEALRAALRRMASPRTQPAP
jgi:hypothetical protein